MQKSRYASAALAGLACSARAFSGPGVLATRGRISGAARPVVMLAAAGELVGDKLPATPSRTQPPALISRIVSAAYTGSAIGGRPAAVVAALSAAAGTFLTARARLEATQRTGWPDPVVAVCEDALVYAAVTFATSG